MMLLIPVDVICEGILPHLFVRDLQALDTAFTNKLYRPQLRKLWPHYVFDSEMDIGVYMVEVQWLHSVGVSIIGVSLLGLQGSFLCPLPSLKRLMICEPYTLYHKRTYKFLNDEWLCQLAASCSYLEVLRLPLESYSDVGITALAQHCHQLRAITLSSELISYSAIQALCDNCPHLQHIDISHCINLTDASLMALARTYPHLQSIHMTDCQFTDDALIFFADKCHELQSMTVGGWRNNITNRGLAILWPANSNIVDLHLKCPHILDDDILLILQCCPLLQSLRLVNCFKITDAAVIALGEKCPRLRSLTMDGCHGVSDTALIRLGQCCHELKSINISTMELITEAGVAALAAGCPLLRDLSLFEMNFSEVGLAALSNCKNLRRVTLVYCYWETHNAISALVKNCPLLAELILMYCDDVDDACVQAIAKHCRNLTILDICSRNVNDAASFVKVVTLCRNLKKMRFPSKFAEVVKKRIPKVLIEEEVFGIWTNIYL